MQKTIIFLCILNARISFEMKPVPFLITLSYPIKQSYKTHFTVYYRSKVITQITILEWVNTFSGDIDA